MEQEERLQNIEKRLEALEQQKHPTVEEITEQVRTRLCEEYEQRKPIWLKTDRGISSKQ